MILKPMRWRESGNEFHRRRSSFNFRGHPIFAGKKKCMKNYQNAQILHDSCRKKYQNTRLSWYWPGKITKIPEFYRIFFCPKNARILHLIALPDPHRLRLWWIPLNWWQQKPSAGDSNMLRKSAMAIHEEGKGWVWYSTVICCMQRTG